MQSFLNKDKVVGNRSLCHCLKDEGQPDSSKLNDNNQRVIMVYHKIESIMFCLYIRLFNACT